MSGEETSGYFEVKVAHYFILGCALFSIFWGVINAVLVKNVKIEKSESVAGTWDHVKKVCDDAKAGGDSEQKGAEEIM